MPQAEPIASENGGLVGGVRVLFARENKAKGGVEIKFSGKPSEEVRAQFHDRANGYWKWSKFQKLWYAKASPSTLAFAARFATGVIAPPAMNEDGPCSDTGYEDQCQQMTGA